ncbi:MAG: hypothetical protein EBQ57_04740 [Actinobacteria bacterium]|nr:hypothetical protein [Actinomycetota bacterium]
MPLGAWGEDENRRADIFASRFERLLGFKANHFVVQGVVGAVCPVGVEAGLGQHRSQQALHAACLLGAPLVDMNRLTERRIHLCNCSVACRSPSRAGNAQRLQAGEMTVTMHLVAFAVAARLVDHEEGDEVP